MHKSYFISDLHLSERSPTITQLFVSFLENTAPEADSLYILGDLFDFWIGDDEKSPLIDTVQSTLKALNKKGVKIHYQHGNRDFMIGKQFAKKSGMILLPDYQVIDLYDMATLLCHGDTLCIDDIKYQRFRKKVHQKWRQRAFLCLPLFIREKIANKIRQHSRSDKKDKSAEIMDVNQEFVRETMVAHKVTHLIHGHTHRQAKHSLKLGSTDATRIVLGDWGERNSILEVNEKQQYIFYNQE